MKVLSLFDGISCARVALERAGIKVDAYFASEIDPYATKISEKNYPDIVRLGDVRNVKRNMPSAPMLRDIAHSLDDIDLLIGGSPCQDLSIAKIGRKGLDGDRSGLFWEYVRILKETNPRYFILENVASMSAEAKQVITDTLGVEPIMIDASLVSAQSRKRLFWTNIPNVVLPEDRHIYLKDIIEYGFVDREKSRTVLTSIGRTTIREYFVKNQGQMVFDRPIQIGQVAKGMSGRVYSVNGKSVALKALGGGSGAKTGLYLVGQQKGKNIGRFDQYDFSAWLEENGYRVRKLTPVECERLQSIPDGYTEGISNTQRYTSIGNGFNADVISHILSFIPRV